ncbi:MAG: protein tyrosine phosphatase family protein [Gammaproteobacteria bacterium]|nr:protein tyrosine phosphatase family protein [Gammaproteobacteria bacterium]
MSVEQARNYRRVDERVATSGSLSEDQLAALGSEGFEAVINLLPPDSIYAVPGEEQIVKRQGIQFHCIPVDFGAPRPEDYESFVRVMDEVRNKKVLVHCAANYRVSVFYSLYARARGEWSSEQAQAFIRSVWDPGHFTGWPEFLEKVEATLNNA